MHTEHTSSSNNLVHPLVHIFSSLKFKTEYLYTAWIYLFYSNIYNVASHYDMQMAVSTWANHAKY